MKRTPLIRRCFCLVLLLAVLVSPALAEQTPETEDRGLDLTETVSVHYPAVTGMADETLQADVNRKILDDLRVEDYLGRAALLISGGSLRTEWTGGVTGTDVFSCALSARGALETAREIHVWTACSLDLRDGHEIGWEELFTDGEEARARIATWLEEEIAPEMSAHLLNSELTPLPERFCMESTGLRLLYPAEQLCTLSDSAGDLQIPWHLLRDVLNLDGDSVLSRMGVQDMITLSAESAEKLRSAAEKGGLPGIPAKLGDPLKPLTDRYHLLTDPDGYEEGRLFALEGSAFQGVYLLSDDLSRAWEDSVVQGIRMDQGCAWGLCVKETSRDAWLEALGEPELTAEIGPEKAELNRVAQGLCDYYPCGEHMLRLYSDENGTLAAMILTE